MGVEPTIFCLGSRRFTTKLHPQQTKRKLSSPALIFSNKKAKKTTTNKTVYSINSIIEMFKAKPVVVPVESKPVDHSVKTRYLMRLLQVF